MAADKLFLPGVGTASEAMKNLEERDLISLVKQVEKPLSRYLFRHATVGQSVSRERARKQIELVECLGLCDGEVKLLQTGDLPLPHMGWNTVSAKAGNPLFKGIEEGEYFYFVHSFAMPVGDYTIAECEYGNPFTAAVQSGNYYGVQFHPERSSKAGAKLIQNFLEL